jgi:hypothetical protein
VLGPNVANLNQCLCELTGTQVRLRSTDVTINSDREQFAVATPVIANAVPDQLQLLARLPKEFFDCFKEFFIYNLGTTRLFELTCSFKHGVQSMPLSYLCQDSGWGDKFDFIQAATLHSGDDAAIPDITRNSRLVLTLELPMV